MITCLICILYLACIALCYSGCASLQIKEGVFFPFHKQYTVSIPRGDWEVTKLSGEDITLRNKGCQATITLITSDIKNEEISLESINARLFIGVKDKKTLVKEIVPVGSSHAMHTVLECIVNGQKLRIDSYIIKSKKKVFDLVYWAPLDVFDYGQGEFEYTVKSFKLLE